MTEYKSVTEKFLKLVVAEGTAPPIVAHRAAVLYSGMRELKGASKLDIGNAILSKLFPGFAFPAPVVGEVDAHIAKNLEPQQTPYKGGVEDWAPALPLYAKPALPSWGNTKPFTVDVASVIRVVSNGKPTQADIAEAKTIGGSKQTLGENSEVAVFWAADKGTVTPPGQFIQIAVKLTEEAGLTGDEEALFFHRLGVALADAGIAAWRVKYNNKIKRPIDLVRTTIDRTWNPLLATPNHPSHVSGHSTFSSAAGEIIKRMIADTDFEYSTNVALPSVSKIVSGTTITRKFASVTKAVEEAGMSRRFGGIHFRLDDVDGQALGKAVAEQVMANIK